MKLTKSMKPGFETVLILALFLSISIIDSSAYWNIIPITDNTTPDLNMRLDESTGHLIWLDNSTNTMYYWDQAIIYTVYSGYMTGYDIDNQNIIFSYWDGSSYEIATWAAGITTQITDNSISDGYPVISGSMLAWQRDLTDWEVMVQDGGSPTQISNNSVSDQGLALNGSDLFWLASNPESRAWRYDGTTAYPVSGISDYATDSIIHDAHGTHAVWIATYGTSGDDREVVYYDGTTAHRLTDNTVDDAFPELYDDRVVWMGKGGIDGGMDYEIFLYDDGIITQLTVNDYQDEYPDVSDTLVAWIQTDSPSPPGDRLIMAFDGISTTTVTTSAYSADSLLLYHDTIYVCLNDGIDRDIYKAVWLPDPTATPSATATATQPPPVIPASTPAGLMLTLILLGGIMIGLCSKTRNQFYMIFLTVALSAIWITPTARSIWQTECIDCQPAFSHLTPDSLQLDGSGNRIIAGGFDHLYLLHQNIAEWEIETIDPSPASGMFASMQIDSLGYAHISYFDDANNHLKYARQIETGWEISTLDTTSNMGYHTSLRLDGSNNPHIAYGNNSASHMGLYYTWFDGSNWQYETVQNEHVPFYISLAFNAADESCIAFMDYYDRKLKYAARDAGSWTIETLVTESECGHGAYLTMDQSGQPHILYHCNGLHHMWHNGSAWQNEQLNSVWTSSMSAFFDASNTLHATWIDETALYYSTWDGSTWSTDVAVAAEPGEILGWSTLLLPTAGYPEIAYGENNSRELRYAVYNGSTWDTSYISRYESPGGYGSVELNQNGYGHTSYTERNFNILRYAWQDALGWQHIDLDTDSYVFYTDLALDSNDNVHIGYYSTNPLSFKYTTNASGDWVTTIVANETGQYCRIAVDNQDHVHAVFEDTFLGGCQYGFYDGTQWTVEPITPATGSIGGHLDICVADDGTPHISFINNTDMNLGYGHRTVRGWELQMNVDDHWWSGEHTSIQLTSQGYPVISYCETQSDDNLRLARWDGTQWSISVLNNDPASFGSYTSLQLDENDYPHVACHGGSGFLYYFEDAAGWHVSDGVPGASESISLNLDASNSPVICYQDSLTWDYKEARYAGPTPPTTTPTAVITSTPTSSSTSSPTPSNTPTQTPTPFMTFTPTPTPWFTTTATPTYSPTPVPSFTPTQPPPPSPTPTEPGECTETGVTIIMPSNMYLPGNSCWCTARVCNMEESVISGYPLFIILDVYSSLFWGPSFGTEFDNYLDLYDSFQPGLTEIQVLPEFQWPDKAGSASGILWYGALTNPDITELFGAFGSFEFGWRNH